MALIATRPGWGGLVLLPWCLLPLTVDLKKGRHPWVSVACMAVLYQGYLHCWALPYTMPGFLLLTLLKSGPFLLLAILKGDRCQPLSVACLWVICEWLNTLGPYGHDGGQLGLALFEYPLLLQSVSWAGPWALSFALAYLGASWFSPSLPRALALVAVMLIQGWWVLSEPPQKPTTTVSLVQYGVDHRLKYRGVASERIAQGLLEMSEKGAQSSQLVIWAETNFPKARLRWNPIWGGRLGRLARRNQCWLLVSALEPVEQKFQNTTHLIGPEGSFQDSYGKQRLVPFVEYLPWEGLLRREGLLARTQRLQAGTGSGVLKVGELSLGMLVCWESMNSELARKRARDGAEMLVVTTNDEWFGNSSVSSQHFAMGVFRALETGRPLVQVANTGISGVIDWRGRIQNRTSLWVRELLLGELQPQSHRTLYAWLGNWFTWLMLGLLLAQQKNKGKFQEN